MKQSSLPLALQLLSVGLCSITLYVVSHQSNAAFLAHDSCEAAARTTDELRKELAEIRQAMDRASREIEGLRTQVTSLRTRPALDDETLNRLALQVTRELVPPLKDLLNEPLSVPPTVGTAAPNAEQRSLIAEVAQLQDGTRAKHHLLWTMKMVAARYGTPDNVTVTDGIVSWNYTWGDYFMSIGFSGDHAVRTHIQKR